MTQAEENALRVCIQRGAPFGTSRWQRTTAARLGLESSLRPRGRPRKPPPTAMPPANRKKK